MIEGAAEWAAFMDQDDFADPVTYQAPGHDPLEILAIFTAADVQFSSGPMPGLNSVTPILTLGRAQLPFDPEPDHTVTVRGDTYRVAEPKPDGTGLIRLLLERI
ncbi:MAG: hypothetical protein AAF376_08960 [Pseudomonadota bacterium]